MVRIKSVILFILLSFFVFANAFAQERVNRYKDWEVYTTKLDGKKACYVASFPKNKSGNYKKRDEPYILVTSINKDIDEVSTSSGYKYKKNSDVRVTVSNKNYIFFSDKDRAWAPDSIKDKELVLDMKRKNFLKVRGTSIKGTWSSDKYSLSGFTAAYREMKKLCEHNG